MADLVWLSDEQWAVMEPVMPKNQPGPERNDDRQVISGLLHGLTSGCRWRDCPAAYGPRTPVHNRWSRRGFWQAMPTALAEGGWVGEAAAINGTYVTAHRSAQGGEGGLVRMASARHVAARPPRSTPAPMSSAAPASSC